MARQWPPIPPKYLTVTTSNPEFRRVCGMARATTAQNFPRHHISIICLIYVFSDEYNWTEFGELKYDYKQYCQNVIEDGYFNDDNSDNWTIEIPKHSSHIGIIVESWQMKTLTLWTVSHRSAFWKRTMSARTDMKFMTMVLTVREFSKRSQAKRKSSLTARKQQGYWYHR